MNNSNKNNSAWAVRLRQPTFGRDFMEAGYTYAPMAFIRPLGDRAPFDPYSTTPYAYYPFKSARNTFLLAYQRRMTDRLTARLEGGRVIRYYNQRFIENDNWEWNGTGTLTYALLPFLRVSGRYTYSNVIARAGDTPGEGRSFSNDGDPSYNRDLYQLSAVLLPKNLWILSSWELTGQYQAYFYTSTQPYWEDNTHVGRKDEIYVGETALGSKALWNGTTLELGYRFTRRASSSAAADNLEEDKNYHNGRVWFGMSYPF